MKDQETFGDRLKASRIKTGIETQDAFADYLAGYDIVHENKAIGHWENNIRIPARRKLLIILQALVDAGGIETLAEVNQMLQLAGYSNYTSKEQQQHFPNLKYFLDLLNLPHRNFDQLIGREEAAQDLRSRLTNPRAKSVVVISGLGGIGKTALAYEVVEQAMNSGQFDNMAWESAKPEEFIGASISTRQKQKLDLHTLLTNYARQLGYDALTKLPPEQLERQLRNILRSGSYLLVLDNLETLETAEDIAHKLYELISPSASKRPSKVLITSRERLVDKPFVYDLFIRGLSEPATGELFHLEAESRGADQLSSDNSYDQQIYKITGGMPLAIKLIVSQFLLGISLEQELIRLEKAVDEQELYRFIYFSLWEKLNISAQKVLVGSATFGTSAQRDHLIKVSRTPSPDFDTAIADLIRYSLIEVFQNIALNQQRYDIHSITRWFVNAPLKDMWQQQKGQ